VLLLVFAAVSGRHNYATASARQWLQTGHILRHFLTSNDFWNLTLILQL